jgi:hypothetical protein
MHARSLRSLLAGAAALAWLGSLALTAPAANAVDTPWTPPTHALPGAGITVSGTGCTTGTTPPKVYVYLNPGTTEDIGSATEVTLATDLSGAWSGTLVVPSTFAPGAYTLWAQCVVSFNYTAIPFTVDDPAATTTTSTTTTVPTTTVPTSSTAAGPTTTAATGTTVPAAAAPATAVAATPTFTG